MSRPVEVRKEGERISRPRRGQKGRKGGLSGTGFSLDRSTGSLYFAEKRTLPETHQLNSAALYRINPISKAFSNQEARRWRVLTPKTDSLRGCQPRGKDQRYLYHNKLEKQQGDFP